jgi:hypothetical protein
MRIFKATWICRFQQTYSSHLWVPFDAPRRLFPTPMRAFTVSSSRHLRRDWYPLYTWRRRLQDTKKRLEAREALLLAWNAAVSHMTYRISRVRELLTLKESYPSKHLWSRAARNLRFQ